MAEEFPRSRVDAVGAAAKINAVEIQLEDLVLAEITFQGERENGFLDLPPKAAVVGQEDVAGELLGNRRGRADPVTLEHRGCDRAANTDGVDPDVTAEAPILGRDHRGAHFRGDA